MVSYADKMVGRLVDAIDELGLRESTLILVTTDNGSGSGLVGMRMGKGVRAGKGQTAEPGICVPLIVSQPGTVPQGAVSHALANIVDMLPTFAELAGAEPDPQYHYDGFSLVEVFHGQSPVGKRKYNLSMGGGNHARRTDAGIENLYHFRDRVVRDGRHKLYIDTSREPIRLYDLKKDPWEEHNLIRAPDMRHKVEELFRSIRDHPARDADPIYDPLKPQSWDVGIKARSQVSKKGQPQEHPADEALE
jgi:arylsulfatase A-like enzyme